MLVFKHVVVVVVVVVVVCGFWLGGYHAARSMRGENSF